ncbi:MAG: hypothetical protein DLM71_06440 [Chloroflexi bacterium]|nr:MAG: hypothetical protein DLM71_06440 [Chloroflexota bacterium]
MRRSPVLALVLGLGLLIGTASSVAAKGGIIARLDVPLPRYAQPGTVVTIGWTLIVPGSSGLIGTGTILRVYPSNGGATVDVPANEDRTGHYVATVTVPAGGIATIGIGIPGESCYAGGGCVPAVGFFTVTDPAGVPIASPPGELPSTATSGAPTKTTDDPSLVGLLVLVGSILLAQVIRSRRLA